MDLPDHVFSSACEVCQTSSSMATAVASEVYTSYWLIMTVSDARCLGEEALSSCVLSRNVLPFEI